MFDRKFYDSLSSNVSFYHDILEHLCQHQFSTRGAAQYYRYVNDFSNLHTLKHPFLPDVFCVLSDSDFVSYKNYLRLYKSASRALMIYERKYFK